LSRVDQLSREKCELIASLNYLKQSIQDIEMRQNQAIQDVSNLFNLIVICYLLLHDQQLLTPLLLFRNQTLLYKKSVAGINHQELEKVIEIFEK